MHLLVAEWVIKINRFSKFFKLSKIQKLTVDLTVIWGMINVQSKGIEYSDSSQQVSILFN